MNSDGVPSLPRLLAIMRRLRDPDDGCEWDRAQTWQTIAPYTIEEAYEVAEACERGDPGELRNELGDLLLQVVFHARIAEEADLFDFEGIAAAIADKMERRHPHIFGNGEPSIGWEAIKAGERAGDADRSVLSGVAAALPALIRADKLQRRAARVGFDWPDAAGPRAKVLEELDEVAAAVDADHAAEEVGDLLFAAVNYARHLGVEPEAALRRATAKFERRFRAMEAMAGEEFAGLDLPAKETLWQAVKRDQG